MSDPGMDITKEATKTAVVELIRPAQEIVADVLGGLFGDHLSNWRKAKPAWQERNQREIAERAVKVMLDRGVTRASDDANPVHVEEIIDASKNTTDPKLKDMYARLIASAMDPKRVNLYRREFVQIVNQLEPLDALVLQLLSKPDMSGAEWIRKIAKALMRAPDEVAVCGHNLERLGCAIHPATQFIEQGAVLAALGRQLIAAVSD